MWKIWIWHAKQEIKAHSMYGIVLKELVSSYSHNSQQALPIWHPACPTWIDTTSRILVPGMKKSVEIGFQKNLLIFRLVN
jgi:hypothetical protein